MSLTYPYIYAVLFSYIIIYNCVLHILFLITGIS